MKLSQDLKERGIIDHVSHDELNEKLDSESLSFYAGYDPTSESLQIGNLFIILNQLRLQKAGHKPYVLIGGATGMIGDPSGKSAERNLLNAETLEKNIQGQKKQLEGFLDFTGKNAAVVVNNFDWMSGWSYLEFLRDVGKRFRLSEMLAKDSVKSRLASDAGISYTEFSYQILQAYDFSFLHQKYGVNLQIGGTDQWGNITAGIDLTRKMHSGHVYGMVCPLVTDSQGKKFGKSEGGETIYLNPNMTSPYKMYQYLLNSDDQVVDKYLKYFTFLSLDDIKDIDEVTKKEPHLRTAQKTLASEVVKLVHGQAGIDSALKSTEFFFGRVIEDVSEDEVNSIFADVPSVHLSKSLIEQGQPLLDVLAECPLFKSKGEARRALQQKGVYINNKPIEESDPKMNSDFLVTERSMIVRKGKKNYCVIKFS